MESLALELTELGHDVSIVATSEEASALGEHPSGLPVWSVRLRNLYWPHPASQHATMIRQLWHLIDIYNFAMRGPLGETLDELRPDAAIVHNLTGWSISALSVLSARKIPIIHVLHDHYAICVNSMMFKGGKNCVGQCVECRVMRAPHRRLGNLVDAVVGVSQYILDRHLAHGVFTNVKVKQVIHNVADPTILRLAEAPALRAKRLALGPAALRFGFIGQLSESKGIEYLLEVFAAWNGSGAELLVAGRGKPDYEAMLRSRFAGETIKFVGQVTPLDFFTAIDVLIVPSLWQENFPGVVVEGLLFGLPIIASRRGGIPELLNNLEGNILFDPDTPGALLRAMDSYLSGSKPHIRELSKELVDLLSNKRAWGDRYFSLLRSIATIPSTSTI
jgi:glycosyltransferase involved in cell wall biosynthesis